MRTQSGQFMFARLAIAICVLLLFSPILSSAQGADPIVGTWNFNGAASDGSDPFIAVISFNLGGNGGVLHLRDELLCSRREQRTRVASTTHTDLFLIGTGPMGPPCAKRIINYIIRKPSEIACI